MIKPFKAPTRFELVSVCNHTFTTCRATAFPLHAGVSRESNPACGDAQGAQREGIAA
jgi:hypothetical protein